MNRKVSLKQRLISAVLVLAMMITSLIGTTFAWFTDSVTSSGNKIESGSLKIDLLHRVDGNWTSLKDDPDHKIFDYDLWEPGYTRVESLKIQNQGSLALKYKLSIEIAEGTAKLGKGGANLADVIDVYVIYSEETADSYTKITETWIHKGTLSDVLANPAGFIGGQLIPTGRVLDGTETSNTAVGSQIVQIALHMKESAGNEYQDLSVGDVFVNLIATQWGYEGDSFGNDYDAGAQFPSMEDFDTVVNVPVVGGVVGSTVTEGNVTVPQGVKVKDGVTTLGTSVKEKTSSDSNVTLNNDEIMRPLDVHVEGVAPDNTVPLIINLGEVMPVGLNIGNYTLYHVENGESVAMTSVSDPADLDAHNEFYYDPNTGIVIVAMATFSEVALVADTKNPWDGKFDYTWYDASKTELTIANADQLAAFGAIVGGMAKAEGIEQDSFSGKTVKLIADINLGDDEENNKSNIIFYPIGYNSSDGTYDKTGVAVTTGFYNFCGTFDGNGNTISNFYQNTWEMKGDNNYYDATLQYYRDGMGLFGKLYGATVKNLTVSNFSSDGEYTTTGAIAAYADGATFENIAITKCNPRVYNIGNGGIVGCVGWYAKEADLKTTFKNITVDNSNKISALWGSYDVACGGIVGQYYPTSGQSSADYPVNGGVSFDNCHISAQMDVYNDVCGNYQYYAYRYAGMMIGSIRENTTNEDGKTIPDMTGITATGCTVNYGDWNDYYYCEFESNGHPSYSGPTDYKFSRVPHSELKFTDSNGNGVVDADERDSVTGCKHNHTESENHQAIYLPFYQLFTGYGWGVSSIGLKEYSGIVTDLGISEGDKEESVVKFEKAENAPETYRPGQTITVGDLFKEKSDSKVPVVGSSVYVSVSPATENDKGSATYNANNTDWTKGTLTFSNDCEGSLKIVITDYFFCNVTVIYLNAEQAAEKFTANTVVDQSAYTSITLGTLFAAKNSANLGDVTATITDPNGVESEVTGTSEDWKNKSFDLKIDGKYTVAIKDNDEYCSVTEVTFSVSKVDKFESKFNLNFLYRVGNANEILFSTLFNEKYSEIKAQNVVAQIDNVDGNAAGSFNNNKFQFTGTGVVKVTVYADGTNSVELTLEVVDAKNITSASSSLYGEDVVLLNNVKISSNGTVHYRDCTVYGNGFTFDVRGGMNEYNSKQGHGIIITVNAVLDNLIIVGDVYETYGAYTDQKDYTSAIDATNTLIQNCHISNCSAPVRANGITIKNTTLYGGTVANLIISGGINTLENVTTVNYNDGRGVVGFGIVISDGANETAKVVLNGELKQYNFISERDIDIVDETARSAFEIMFNDSYAAYQFTKDGVRYVNLGILSMVNTFNKDDITDNTANGYVGSVVQYTTYKGYLYSLQSNGNSIDNEYDINKDTHKATTQGDYLPTFDFNLGDQALSKDGDEDDRYLIGDKNGIEVLYLSNATPISLNLTTLANIVKYNTKLNVTVSYRSADGKILGKDTTVELKTSGTLVFTATDNVFYDKNGKALEKSVEVIFEVPIDVSIKEAKIKNATITVSKTEINGDYNSSKYMTFNPLEAITITDYDANGIGTTVTLNKNISSKTVEYANTSSGAWGGATITITYTDGRVLTVHLGTSTLNSPGSSNGGKTITIQSDGSIKTDGKVANSSATGGTWTINGYSFKGNNGSTVTNNTKVTVKFADESGCVTSDTLVTLADGTQKRIDEVTYEDQLLVWNLFTGSYDVVPSAIIFYHGDTEYDVLNLKFSDGTIVKVINSHGFFDVAENQFVFINENNAHEYLGHSFVKVDGESYKYVELVGYEVVQEYTGCYSIQSAVHINFMVEGMFSLTIPPFDGWFDYFEIGEGMKYDEEKMQADIEEYGLYTYEDFAEYVTYEQFIAFNGPYLKVLVGRGVVTYEEILQLISTYVNP